MGELNIDKFFGFGLVVLNPIDSQFPEKDLKLRKLLILFIRFQPMFGLFDLDHPRQTCLKALPLSLELIFTKTL